MAQQRPRTAAERAAEAERAEQGNSRLAGDYVGGVRQDRTALSTTDFNRLSDRVMRDPDMVRALQLLERTDECDPRAVQRANAMLAKTMDESVREAAQGLNIRLSTAQADVVERQLTSMVTEGMGGFCPVTRR